MSHKTTEQVDMEKVEHNNVKTKEIIRNIGIGDRVIKTAEKPTFVTIKEYKDNFRKNPTCRLINPTKPELGRISKQFLEKINSKLIERDNTKQ